MEAKTETSEGSPAVKPIKRKRTAEAPAPAEPKRKRTAEAQGSPKRKRPAQASAQDAARAPAAAPKLKRKARSTTIEDSKTYVWFGSSDGFSEMHSNFLAKIFILFMNKSFFVSLKV